MFFFFKWAIDYLFQKNRLSSGYQPINGWLTNFRLTFYQGKKNYKIKIRMRYIQSTNRKWDCIFCTVETDLILFMYSIAILLLQTMHKLIINGINKCNKMRCKFEKFVQHANRSESKKITHYEDFSLNIRSMSNVIID